PTIAGLVGGADAYGLTNLTRANFASIVAGMHATSGAAVVLLDVGPTGYADNYTGYDMLLYINLLGAPLSNPKLGAGATDFSKPLLVGGYANDPAFGGAGAQTLTQIGGSAVYATLVPTGTTNFQASFGRNGTTFAAAASSLSYGVPLYVDSTPPPRVSGTPRIDNGTGQRSQVHSLTVTFDTV